MLMQYPKQRMDLVILLATFQRIEMERNLAWMDTQKGHHNAAVDCLRRLARETQGMAAILTSSLWDSGFYDKTYATVETLVNQQLALISTQLGDVELEAARLSGAAPLPDMDTSNIPTAQAQKPFRPATQLGNTPLFPPSATGSREFPFPPPAYHDIHKEPRQTASGTIQGFAPPPEKHKPWPTADPSYSRPALEHISLREEQVGMRVAGDVGGAVHIRRQLDEQEERAEMAAVAKWRIEIGLDPAPSNWKANPLKRRGDELLPSNTNKRQHIEDQSPASASRLRGGRDHSAKWSIRNVLKNFLPLKKGSKSGSSKNKNNNNLTRDKPPKLDNTGRDQQSPKTATYDSSLIKTSALQVISDPAGTKERDVRDTLFNLVWLCERTPYRISHQADSSLSLQKQQIQQALDELGTIPVDEFDIAGTRQAMEYLQGDFDVKSRRVPQSADEEWQKENVLNEVAGTTANLQDKLDRKRAFAAKVFVGGEETAEVFVRWIATERRRLEAEMEFGVRACQAPRAERDPTGFGLRKIYVV